MNPWKRVIHMVEKELLMEVIVDMRSLADRHQVDADAAVEGMPEGERLLTQEEVRAALAEKANAGYTAGVKRLIAGRGASRLSEIDPAEYVALLAEAEAL